MIKAVRNEAALTGARVLVAEDNDDIRELLSYVLVAAGARIELASDGDEAFRKAQVGDFDLIVLDLLMPELSGFEVFDRLKGAGSRTPVVALTAHALKDDVTRTLDHGFADLVLKPFRTSDFLAAVVRVLRGLARG